MIYCLGIDPGADGAAALVNMNGLIVSHIGFKKYSKDDIIKWFRHTLPDPGLVDIRCLLEKVHGMPNQDCHSTFTFGHNAGFIEAVALCTGFTVELVTPQKWQRAIDFSRPDLDYSKRKTALNLYAQSLFPRQKFLKPVADAILIAHAGFYL